MPPALPPFRHPAGWGIAALALAGFAPMALATETYNPANNTLAISDLRIAGASYAVTLAVQPQPNSQGYYYANITGLSPNNSCTRGVYKHTATNSFYYMNTYTQNGVEVGGVEIAKAAKIGNETNTRGVYFSAVWTAQPPAANPLLNGYAGAPSLAAGRYGVVGFSGIPGLNQGDSLSVQGNTAQGYALTDLVTQQVFVLTPVTGTSVTQLPCPATSGTYAGPVGSSYVVSLYGSGSGSLAPATASDPPFSASWSNGAGSLSYTLGSDGTLSYGIGVLDIGQSALALYTFDPQTKVTNGVLVVGKQD